MLHNKNLDKANKIHSEVFNEDELIQLKFKTLEEMAELQIELCTDSNREKVIREIIDVQICIDKLLQVYKVSEEEHNQYLEEKATKYLRIMNLLKSEIGKVNRGEPTLDFDSLKENNDEEKEKWQ